MSESPVIPLDAIFAPPMASEFVCSPDTHGHCATCSDELKAAHVLEVQADLGLALVDLDGLPTEVDISLIDNVAAGQMLLIHGGAALERLDEALP